LPDSDTINAVHTEIEGGALPMRGLWLAQSGHRVIRRLSPSDGERPSKPDGVRICGAAGPFKGGRWWNLAELIPNAAGDAQGDGVRFCRISGGGTRSAYCNPLTRSAAAQGDGAGGRGNIVNEMCPETTHRTPEAKLPGDAVCTSQADSQPEKERKSGAQAIARISGGEHRADS